MQFPNLPIQMFLLLSLLLPLDQMNLLLSQFFLQLEHTLDECFFVCPVFILSLPSFLSTLLPKFKLFGNPLPYNHIIWSRISNPASSIAMPFYDMFDYQRMQVNDPIAFNTFINSSQVFYEMQYHHRPILYP